MKKFNQKGFTLIELLAVITIMGILMMVAIPNISRTIENSRKDTFVDLAKQYINVVRNAVMSDDIYCVSGMYAVANKTAFTDPGSSIMPGKYYFIITSSTMSNGEELRFLSGSTDESARKAQSYYIKSSDINALMEKGGKSPWGSAEVIGAVAWEKDDAGKSTYYVMLVDSAGHGITTLTEESSLKRSSVSTSISDSDVHSYAMMTNYPASNPSANQRQFKNTRLGITSSGFDLSTERGINTKICVLEASKSTATNYTFHTW